jgi:hypothetical protein
MSRIDDERDAQRAREKLALERRQQEDRAKVKVQDSAFAKKVQQSHQAQTKGKAAAEPNAPTFHSVLDHLTAGVEDTASARAYVRAQERALAGRTDDQKISQGQRDDRAKDARGQERAQGGRSEDAEAGRKTLAGRGQDSDRTDRQRADIAHQGAVQRRGEREQGGAGGQGGGQDKREGGGGDLPGSMKLMNPALMAPPPVAKPRENSASERLRALANELAQRIVERVRVGTNAAGAAEFQIDLRSNVLAGLSIKVSGSNGKIRAVFQSRDKEVRKLLESNAETLKKALTARGLKLEEMKIES